MSYQIKASERTNTQFQAKMLDRRELMRRIASRGHSLILKRLAEGVKPENSALTKAIKKGDKPLFDNGKMAGSITYRSDESEAIVGSNNVAAMLNNPEDDSTEYEVKAKKGWLTVPAGWKTRTLMRRYGFTPTEVINGLRNDGYSVFRPFKKGSNTTRANVIMAVKKTGGRGKASGRRLKNGGTSQAAKWEAFAVFILLKSVKIPVRRFLFLDAAELSVIDQVVEDFYR